jgi:hypothetical protein
MTESAEERYAGRLEELDGVIERFHETVWASPELWHVTGVVAPALNAAREHVVVANARDRELRRRYQKERAERYASQAHAADEPVAPDVEPPDLLELHRFRAIEGFGEYLNALDHLRRLTAGKATYYRDVERRARLSWLLDLLASVQPQLAGEIREVWKTRRDSPEPLAHRAERFERETIEALVMVLAPLLEPAG